MPYDLSALESNCATCTSQLGIEVTYRIANMTERVVRQLRVLGDSNNNQEVERNLVALRGVVCRLVIRWDLTDHGKAIPITSAAVADVPPEVLADVLRAVMEDVQMGEAAGTRSPQPSRGPSATASNGSSGKRVSTASRRN